MSDERERSPAGERQDALAKKKRVRAGHRSSVTRILGQLDGAVTAADTRKLKQLKLSLTEKAKTLLKLDDEIVEETFDEEQLEAEIEQADVIREKINLALISVDEALEAIAASVKRESPRREASDSSSPSATIAEQGNPSTVSVSEGRTSSVATTSSLTEPPPVPVTTTAFMTEWSPAPVAATASLTDLLPTLDSHISHPPDASFRTGAGAMTTASFPLFTPNWPLSAGLSFLPSAPLRPRVTFTSASTSCSSATLSILPPGTSSLPSSAAPMLPVVPPAPPTVPTFPSFVPQPLSANSPFSHTMAPPSNSTPPLASIAQLPSNATSPVLAGMSSPPSVSGLPANISMMPNDVSHPLSGSSAASPISPVTSSPSNAWHAPTPTAHSQVKLPKLTMKRFNGDLTKWVTFWDSFDSAIHSNPRLSNVDKFSYLHSLLDSSAAEAIAGLTLTSANYEEAISTLKQRFGNTQLIVNKHMNALLHLPSVASHHDLKGLRRLYDSVEANVRGLRALGVSANSYGSLLTSILMDKLPSEVRIVVSRELTGGMCNMEELMSIVSREVSARERSSASSMNSTHPHKRPLPGLPLQRGLPSTAAALMTSNRGMLHCVYCDQGHRSNACAVVTSVAARKEVLRKAGRCYVCLRKHHLSRDCRSPNTCEKCHGRHHTSICPRMVPAANDSSSTTRDLTRMPQASTASSVEGSQRSTTNIYVDAQTPVLLQTAKVRLYNPSDSQGTSRVIGRLVMDSGSQRTYVTSRVKQALNLTVLRSESLYIKTFGARSGVDCCCDVVEFGLETVDGEPLKMTALVVPLICNPLTSQPISESREDYPHLAGLDLADSADIHDCLEVDVLVGSDLYWSLVTGRVQRGANGPLAIHTRVGWVLSGPVDQLTTCVNLTLNTTNTLQIDTISTSSSLDDQLKRFWELESLGVMKDEASVYTKFTQKISLSGDRYQVSLPWKDNHLPLCHNYELSLRRLQGLLKRLKQNPPLLTEYDSIIKDQLSRGIVEPVECQSVPGERVHYLPHHGVVRQDKTTSKLRIVYDASAKTTGPSLNDCLYTGPSFGQSILDILLRFRVHKIALAGDIEKAFLMISVEPKDRDCLRFLWVRDVAAETPEVVVLRFTRVAFGVRSSPFLLNATINHHLETYRHADPLFVEKFLSSIYVDDLSLGADDVDSTYKLYLKSKLRLAEAGFKLRKFITNSAELRQLIAASEQPSEQREDAGTISEEDQSYAKGSLGEKGSEAVGVHKILGIQWDFKGDNFIFNIADVCHYMEECQPTKRSVVSMAARFFDPLGIVSPVTVNFKIFFQQLCEEKVDWDEPLTGALLTQWNRLRSSLNGPEPLQIPRCYFYDMSTSPVLARLVGFCDASTKAYAAVVYLRLEAEAHVRVKFLAAKTRVTPMSKVTVPRLELLSALLLSKLVVTIQDALKPELTLCDPTCYSDSKVALYWIKGYSQEWKQFVENRVRSIRAAIPAQHWHHCPGYSNPADLPSRGTTASELLHNPLWLNGPHWLYECQDEMDNSETDTPVPEECLTEMKKTVTNAHTLVTTQDSTTQIGQVIECTRFSSLRRLLRVTAVVLAFIHTLRAKVQGNAELQGVEATVHLDYARLLWLREVQIRLPSESKFPLWKRQLDLFVDDHGLWRCGGRMQQSDLSPSAQHPILLDRRHHVTTLLIMDAHHRVRHNGTRETLTELRSNYWLVRGRQFVRKLIHKCLVCRRLEGRPHHGVPPPALPEFRVRQSRPFQNTGVDFAGPLYVKGLENPKVWLCLYTCCVTRAVHLELVPDLNTTTFIRSFKRFTSRRGMPRKMVSDNGKTFKAGSKVIREVTRDPVVRKHFADLQVDWKFNLERAPWWGGFFERLIGCAKRCLRKSLGRASLTYDELFTVITEIEAVLNSRPLTYVDSDDLEEPLTPSHLLYGYRILSLPDPSAPDVNDPDYEEPTRNLSRRMRYTISTCEHFWKRWRTEYLQELREFHRKQLQNADRGSRVPIWEGQIVTVHEKGAPRLSWRLGRIEKLIVSPDERVRGAEVRVSSGDGHYITLRRPVQHLYPLEVEPPEQVELCEPTSCTVDGDNTPEPPNNEQQVVVRTRPRRAAAEMARNWIVGCLDD